MSYQSSIHFDPTALLIIKNELDNRIQQVEAAVNTLVEDQSLPFGIDDTLNQLEQCVNVVALIDMPQLAQLFQDCATLMRQIMQHPNQINVAEVSALSEGTGMLKRYIEFICLREVKVSQFLLDTFNRLQQALGKPLSKEGFKIEPLLNCFSPQFKLPELRPVQASPSSHLLFKQALNALLTRHFSSRETQALNLAALHFANTAKNMPSAEYWQLVALGLSHSDTMLWSESRLRALIQIERNMALFLADQQQFQASSADIADALSLCISQEDDIAEYIRQQLNIQEDILSDAQLQVMRRHLFGPDHETIYTICRLMSEIMMMIRHQLEDHYQIASQAQVDTMQSQLKELASLFNVLNLSEVANDLNQQLQQLNRIDYLHDDNNSQTLLSSIEHAMNAMGILERHHRSVRLHLAVNNLDISLDRLDDAHTALLNESQHVLDQINQKLSNYVETHDLAGLASLDLEFYQLGGAALFLGSEPLHTSLWACSRYITHKLAQQSALEISDIQALYDVVAGIDGLIDNLKNHQPILQSMFDVAQHSSQQLQTTA